MRPDPRPPRRICSRRPVSSGATGRRGNPAQDGHTSRSAGCTPRLRSPFPSVSSSSSSFCLPRFPEVVPVAFFSPGFGSRACFSEPLARLFDQVQVSENHVRPEFVFRRRSRGFGPIRPAFLPSSALPPPAPAGFSSGTFGFRFAPSVFPVYQPVPASCSARLLFVSFMVRISGLLCCSVQFSSVQFVLFRVGSIRWVQFVSCVFLSVQVSLISSGFELIFLFPMLGARVIYIILAYIIHDKQ